MVVAFDIATLLTLYGLHFVTVASLQPWSRLRGGFRRGFFQDPSPSTCYCLARGVPD